MPTPSLSKTWQFNVNNSLPTGGTALIDHRRNMLKLKQILVAFATLGWVVRSSSNAVVANTNDNWAAEADLVSVAAAGTAHSWIVLRQTGLGPTSDICIDLIGGAGLAANCQAFYSPGGYVTTGLSTLNRPTTNVASDEVQWVGVNNIATTWINSGGGTFSSFVSGMQSTDGQCTRLFIVSTAGSVLAAWFFEKLQSPTTGINFPVIVGSPSQGADALIYANLGLTSQALSPTSSLTPISRARFDASTLMRCSWASEGWANTTFYAGQRLTAASDLTGAFPMTPITVHADTVSPNVGHGRLGMLADIWFGTTGVTSGDTYATKTFVQWNNVIFPWDGSVPSGPAASTDRTGELVGGVGDAAILSSLPVRARPGLLAGFGSPSPPRNQPI